VGGVCGCGCGGHGGGVGGGTTATAEEEVRALSLRRELFLLPVGFLLVSSHPILANIFEPTAGSQTNPGD
jgi:hypothetical protein